MKTRFGTWITEIMDTYALTEREIADMAGVSNESTVSKWITDGAKPRRKTVKRLVAGLNGVGCMVTVKEVMDLISTPVEFIDDTASIEETDFSTVSLAQMDSRGGNVDDSGWGLTYKEVTLLVIGIVVVIGSIARGELAFLIYGNVFMSILSVVVSFAFVYLIQTILINRIINYTVIQRLANWFSSGQIMIGGGNGKK